ncbi:hypothetical protein D1627_02990 [Pontibacter oryzae]|uniref:TonB-dependent receptor n=2 Tax=Pontibacter oryzae TaxID=2304593 RepID=A0A399SJM5_9BACT|nr:hypothetical protein D1627_02990 [Pontibacter oryzae]
MAQGVKPSLDAAPVPDSTVAAPAASAPQEAAQKPAWTGPKLSYSLNMGASFSNGYGSASFIEPSVRYQVSNRFRLTTSLAYIRTTPYSTSVAGQEGTTVLYRNNGGNHYIASVGVDYLASERLILSGNIWRDFSNIPADQFNAGFNSPGRMGADFRATYKITENFSVTGGIRYTDGASPYSNPHYSPFAPGLGGRNGYWN